MLRKPPEKIVTKTEYREKAIQPASPVKPIELYDVEVMVVSEKNIDEWMKTMRESEGQIAVIAMTVRGYENLALNISEMERYIKQQKEVIIYYEKAVAPSDAEKK
jgi:hypothetical protein